MKLLSYKSGKAWVPIEAPDTADDTAKASALEHRRRLDQALGDSLLADNLVVLCGLGTSLCVKDAAGHTLAPSMADLWAAAQAQAAQNFESIREKANYETPAGGDNIELLLSRCQILQHIQPDPLVAAFIADAEKMIVHKCRFLSEAVDIPVHEAFLRKVARRSTRKPRMKLFTSNYDLCFETAASRTGFVVVDGFSYALPQEFDGIHFGYDFVRRDIGRDIPDYIPNVFQLYKLHGSVTWERRGPRILKAQAPEKPLIIYPRDSKFESSYDQPFIEMMSRFQMALRLPNTGLLVMGFGFNDRHLTEPIMSAIRSNASMRAVFVSPGLEASQKAPVTDIAHLVGSGDTRLMMIGATFEELVPLTARLSLHDRRGATRHARSQLACAELALHHAPRFPVRFAKMQSGQFQRWGHLQLRRICPMRHGPALGGITEITLALAKSVSW